MYSINLFGSLVFCPQFKVNPDELFDLKAKADAFDKIAGKYGRVDVLYNNADPKETLYTLFDRDVKVEFSNEY